MRREGGFIIYQLIRMGVDSCFPPFLFMAEHVPWNNRGQKEEWGGGRRHPPHTIPGRAEAGRRTSPLPWVWGVGGGCRSPSALPGIRALLMSGKKPLGQVGFPPSPLTPPPSRVLLLGGVAAVGRLREPLSEAGMRPRRSRPPLQEAPCTQKASLSRTSGDPRLETIGIA